MRNLTRSCALYWSVAIIGSAIILSWGNGIQIFADDLTSEGTNASAANNPQFDYDGDGLLPDNDPYIAKADELLITINSFEIRPDTELKIEQTIMSKNVVLDKSTHEYGVQVESGVSANANFNASISPLGALGVGSASIAAHASASTDVKFQFGATASELFSSSDSKTYETNGWKLRVWFDLANSSTQDLTLKQFSLALSVVDKKGQKKLLMEWPIKKGGMVSVDGKNKEIINQLPASVQGSHGTRQIVCTFPLRGDQLFDLFAKGQVISLSIEPTEIEIEREIENDVFVKVVPLRSIRQNCSQIELSVEGDRRINWVSVIDANKTNITIEELLQRFTGNDDVAWETFDGTDYLSLFKQKVGSPIPLPYKEDNGYWRVQLTNRNGKEVVLTRNWRKTPVSPNSKITIAYKTIKSYLSGRYIYSSLPRIETKWQKVVTAERVWWKDVFDKENAGAIDISTKIKNGLERVKEQDGKAKGLYELYDELITGIRSKEIFDNGLFITRIKRLHDIFDTNVYQWEEFEVHMERVELNWFVTKDEPNKLDDPVFDITAGNNFMRFQKHGKESDEAPIAGGINFHRSLYLDGDPTKVVPTFIWTPFSNVKALFYEDNPTGFDVILMENDLSRFVSLHHLVSENPFGKPGFGIDPKKSKLRVRMDSIKGPLTELPGKHFNGPEGLKALHRFILDNLPRVVDLPRYRQIFDHDKLTRALVTSGEQIGYNQAAILNEGVWRSSPDQQNNNYLVDAIRFYFLCLDFEKVHELGIRFKEMPKQNGGAAKNPDPISDLIRDANECIKLDVSDPLFEYVYQIQSAIWAFQNIETLERATVLQIDPLKDRCEFLLKKLNSIGLNPPLGADRFKYVQTQHDDLKLKFSTLIDILNKPDNR